MRKKCFKCGIRKNINQFYVHKQMRDGHLGKCKKCTKKDVNLRYNDPEAKKRIVEYEKLRFQNPDRKLKVKLYRQKRDLLFPGKYRARFTLNHKLNKGEIKKKPCEVCGEQKVQAHHTDYRKPTAIKWLCFKHHRELHGQKTT